MQTATITGRETTLRRGLLAAACVLLGAIPAAQAQEPMPDAESLEAAFPGRSYSPYANRGFPDQVLWGDSHLHTGMSFDAGAFGARLMPRDAYRFARGEEVVSSTGVPARLSRPLDWLVVADHSDYQGFFADLIGGEPALLRDETARRWYDLVQEGGQSAVLAASEAIFAFSSGTMPSAVQEQYVPGAPRFDSAWEVAIDAAEEFNDPGVFTSFIGYEWTSTTMGNNLHRVVIFRDGADLASRTLPYTTQGVGSDNPRDLWNWMEAYETETGGDVLAIAHNGNLSNGRMFTLTDTFTGEPFDAAYAETRARWEPLYEATQIKGDGETHPLLSPDDEFADYGTWDVGNLNLSEMKTDDMLPFEYARSGLLLGLQLEAELGTNPYQFGMIGSTDSHTALSTTDEESFFGKHSGGEPSPDRAMHPLARMGDNTIYNYQSLASGLAAVWATENTREAIFDAMERREVYATTGTRMMVRFFGGWGFEPEHTRSRDLGRIGYREGVPMGEELTARPDDASPSFLVYALRDPIGANLDRIQIVKGWRNADGTLEEQVYDVAWSGDREPNRRGNLPPVGNTVDLENATWTNTIGAAELITVWQDPDFDPRQRAFYYARVLEIPTPRWVVYDEAFYGIELPDDVERIHQERAYTSPIWYTP